MGTDDRHAAGVLEQGAATEAADLLDQPTHVDEEVPDLSRRPGMAQRLDPLVALAPKTAFFPLVALLEQMTPESVRVGGDGPPSQETLRFRHLHDLTFGAGDVAKASIKHIPVDINNPLGATRPIVQIVTTFLGLTGSITPLPLYLADEVNHEDAENAARGDFLDIFHHRLVSLMYRAVTRYSPVREHRVGEKDKWMDRGFSLAGLDPEAMVPHSAIPRGKLMRLAPIVARRGRGVRALNTALRITLEDHLGAEGEVFLREFSGGWSPIHQGQQSTLGKMESVLGEGAKLGSKVFDRSGHFLVGVGPLDATGRRAFSEGGEALEILKSTVELVVNEPLEYDVELTIGAGAAQPFVLSATNPGRLGADTRLGAREDGEVVRLRNVGRFSKRSSEKQAET